MCVYLYILILKLETEIYLFIYLFIYLLVMSHSLWDLSSLTRDQTQVLVSESTKS